MSKIRIGKTFITTILILSMFTAIILPCFAAASTSSQVVKNAQDMYDNIKEHHGGIKGYVDILINQRLSYDLMLNEAAFYNEVYDTFIDFGSTGIDLICSIVTGGAAGALKEIPDQVMTKLVDELTMDLPKMTIEEFIYTQARAGLAQVNLSELMDIGFKIENECGGKVSSVADAVRFIRVNQEIKMGFAALRMGRSLYYEQLNASPWDMLLDMFTKHSLSYVSERIGAGVLEQYVRDVTTEKVYELFTLLIDAVANPHYTTYMNSVIEISKETERLISYTVDDFGKEPPVSPGTSTPEQTPAQTPPSIQTVTYVKCYYDDGGGYNQGDYEGEMLNGKPHGWGKLKYSGFEDGKFYSLGLNGTVIKAISYEGNFVNGFRKGYGTVIYECGYKDEGTFSGLWKAGKITFEGKRWLENDDFEGYWPVIETAGSDENASPQYGEWVSTKQRYSISYHANGGQNAPAVQEKNKDVGLTLQTDIPVRTGYSFQGWSTNANAASADYQPGSLYVSNSSAVLYAVWKKNERSAKVLNVRLETGAVNGDVISVEYEAKGYSAGEIWLIFEDSATGKQVRYAPTANDVRISVSPGQDLTPGRTYKVYFLEQFAENSMAGSNYALFEYPFRPNAFLYSESSAWAKDSITRAYDMGLLPDYMLKDYSAVATRIDFVRLAYAAIEKQRGSIQQVLYNLSMVPDLETGPNLIFTDVPQYCGYDKYDQYRVASMNALGIINGVGNNKFAPDRAITREEAAVMLSRVYAFLEWGDVRSYTFTGSTDNLYVDNNSISNWAFNDVYNMQAIKVMNGVGNNRFAPKGNHTVEESIVTFVRILDSVS